MSSNIKLFISSTFLSIIFVTLSFAQKNMDWKVPPYEVEGISLDETPFPQFLEDDAGLKITYVLLYDLPDKAEYMIDKVELESEEPKVYSAADLDKMPLFEEACAETTDPMACSYEKAAAFFRDNIKFPEQALDKQHSGLEQLVFTINENGWVDGKIKVMSNDKPCAGCAKAAVEAAYNMPAWRPAMVDGKKVKAMVILPIRFETEVLYEDK